MGGVIVVDAGRSRSTCLGRDAYIHDHCLEYRHNYVFSINCAIVIHLLTVCFLFEREASSENYGPQVYLYHILNPKIPCRNLFSVILFYVYVYLSITMIFDPCN